LPTLVLDAGNGAWSESAPQIFARLGFHLERISCVLDGRFPDRSSDCSRPANLLRLREQVARTDYALGIAWDGDGDRVAIVDEAGQFVSADELSMLFARELLGASRTSRTVSPQVVLDIKLASAVQREVERLGGIPLLERTGHAFLRTRMVAAQAALGLDACGHFFFGELNGADDGVFAALMLLSMIQRTGLSLNELVKQLPQTHGTPELRIPLALLKYEEAEVELLKVFSGWSVDRLDGVRLTAEQGVVLLRRSGTESVLSLRIEGTSRAAYEMLVAKCVDAFPSTRGTIESQLREHWESAPTVSSAENSAAELG
jgi:phosphomannomutase